MRLSPISLAITRLGRPADPDAAIKALFAKGFTWKVTQADGSGNNVWEPGVFGWTKV